MELRTLLIAYFVCNLLYFVSYFVTAWPDKFSGVLMRVGKEMAHRR